MTYCHGFRLFLTGRSQRVVIDNVLSNPMAVGSGVVQGYRFLDLLFSFYSSTISLIALTLVRSIQLHVAFLLTT